MNIIDALAIAPYYIDLFFMPPPNFDIPENPDEVYSCILQENPYSILKNVFPYIFGRIYC